MLASSGPWGGQVGLPLTKPSATRTVSLKVRYSEARPGQVRSGEVR